MKKYILVLSIFLTRIGSAYSQADIDLQLSFTNFMIQTHSQFAKGQLADFTGMGGKNRYWANVWVTGTATNPHDVTLGKSYWFNFDFKEHELYAQWKDTAIVVNSNYLKSFMLMENGLEHYFFRAPFINIKYFYQSLGYDPESKTGRVQLLKQRTVEIRKTNKNDYAAFGDYSDKVVSVIEYYIVMPDEKFSRVKLTKKSLSAALPAYKDKINEYFAVNSDKLDDYSAANLIRYINQ